MYTLEFYRDYDNGRWIIARATCLPDIAERIETCWRLLSFGELVLKLEVKRSEASFSQHQQHKE